MTAGTNVDRKTTEVLGSQGVTESVSSTTEDGPSISKAFLDGISTSLLDVLGIPIDVLPPVQVRIEALGGIVSSKFDDDRIEVTLNQDYANSIPLDVRSKEIEGIVYNQVANHLVQNLKTSGLPEWFKSGVTDYVRVKLDRESPWWPARTLTDDYKTGWRVAAYFIKWVEDSREPPPWSARTVLEASTVPSEQRSPEQVQILQRICDISQVDDLWGRYQARLVKDAKAEVTTYCTRPTEPRLILIDEGGSNAFFDALPEPLPFLHSAYLTVISLLYPTSQYTPKRISSMTFILSPTATGVAETNDTTITFAMAYVNGYAESHSTAETQHEIKGILLHELVHVMQYDGEGNTPGGLIEGMADVCRLKAGLAAAHWRRGTGGRWDSGYQTTAYFLKWIEENRCRDFVPKCNDALRSDWDEGWCKTETGKGWEQLWDEYQDSMKPSQVGSEPQPAHPPSL